MVCRVSEYNILGDTCSDLRSTGWSIVQIKLLILQGDSCSRSTGWFMLQIYRVTHAPGIQGDSYSRFQACMNVELVKNTSDWSETKGKVKNEENIERCFLNESEIWNQSRNIILNLEKCSVLSRHQQQTNHLIHK